MDMLQLCHQLRFRLETADEIRMVGELWLDHLDGHIPPDHRLVGLVDRPVAADPEQVIDAEVGDAGAG